MGGRNPEYTRWSRIVMGLAAILLMLMGASLWASFRYVEQENEEGRKDLLRDIGVYTGAVLASIAALGMAFCACTVNNPYTLQCFALFAVIFAIMFVALAASQLRNGDLDGEHTQLFITFSFLIGLVLCISSLASLRLSRLEDFLTGNEEEKDNNDEPFAEA